MLVEVLLQQERSALLGIGGASKCEWHPPSPNPPSNPVPAGVVARPLLQSERRVDGFPRLWRGAREAGVWVVRDGEAGGCVRRSITIPSVVAVSAVASVASIPSTLTSIASTLTSIASTLTSIASTLTSIASIPSTLASIASIPSTLASHTSTHRGTTALTQHTREPIPHSVLRRTLPQPDQRLQLPPHRQVASPPRPHI